MDAIQLSVRRAGEQCVVSVTLEGRRVDSRTPLPRFGEAEAGTLRWLLEDLPRLASESARSAGVLAQLQLEQLGRQIFEAVREPFEAARAGRPLHGLALQIDDPDGLARHLPWELMRDGDEPLAQACGAFTRRVPRAADAAPRVRPAREGRPLRLLMVVSRPAGTDDVAFRSVASRVLAAAAGPAVEVDLLRPASFAALRQRLRDAWKAGRPYDILHVDGHGTPRTGADGRVQTALAFEPDAIHPDGLIDAETLGTLLAAVDVPLLILNACHAAAEARETGAPEAPGLARAQATMSLAESVAAMAGGDVVALSQAVYVATAALVVEDLHACLQRGIDVGPAVAFARRRWGEGAVPRSPSLGYCSLRHFSAGSLTGAGDGETAPDWPAYAEPARFGDRTPARPGMAAAFAVASPLVAMDDPLLLLEQALRSSPVVQLNGLRGSGKTTLLLELGRWLVASNAAPAARVQYLDLATAGDAAAATEAVARSTAAFLLIDQAEQIHGDPLRARSAWPTGDLTRWIDAVQQKAQAGARLVVASPAPLPLPGQATRVFVPRLSPPDIRSLVELQAGAATARALPEAAIRWTGGHPGSAAVLVERAQAGAFADAEKTLDALARMSLGMLDEDAPGLLQQVQPLLLAELQPLFASEARALLPWLLIQPQGQLHLTPLLWKLADSDGLKSLAEAAANGQVDTLLGLLEQAGLVTRLDAENLLLHPLMPFVIPQPCNHAGMRQAEHWRLLRHAMALHVRATQLLYGGSPHVAERRPPAVAADWELGSLLHAFSCATDSGGTDHLAALSLARQLRGRLLAMDPALWPALFAHLCAAFDKTPPPPDDGLFNPNNVYHLLRMEEAQRTGDEAGARTWAERARAAAEQLPGATLELPGGQAGPDLSQINRYDTLLKTGRLLARSDRQAARSAFESALLAAGDDVLRRAQVCLELTRLLRGAETSADREAARVYGEEALATYVEFVQHGLADRSQVSQAAMSLSNIYRDLAFATRPPDPEHAARGETLCRASLDYATTDGERATAWINLGGWRRDARDPAAAAGHFLEAANLYETMGNVRLLGTALAYRAECLLDDGQALQARIDGVRATSLLVGLPDKPRDLIAFAYQTAERAQAVLARDDGAALGDAAG